MKQMGIFITVFFSVWFFQCIFIFRLLLHRSNGQKMDYDMTISTGNDAWPHIMYVGWGDDMRRMIESKLYCKNHFLFFRKAYKIDGFGMRFAYAWPFLLLLLLASSSFSYRLCIKWLCEMSDVKKPVNVCVEICFTVLPVGICRCFYKKTPFFSNCRWIMSFYLRFSPCICVYLICIMHMLHIFFLNIKWKGVFFSAFCNNNKKSH